MAQERHQETKTNEHHDMYVSEHRIVELHEATRWIFKVCDIRNWKILILAVDTEEHCKHRLHKQKHHWEKIRAIIEHVLGRMNRSNMRS